MLVVFAGLPATGKSSIASVLAREMAAVWLRIDSIEQALRESGATNTNTDGAGYEVAYRLAEDNLRLGRDVIGDCVNPWARTRDAWRQAGLRAGAEVLEVEIICSDAEEHRRRVETRHVDVPGLPSLQWQDILDRDYHGWDRDHLIIDTAYAPLRACVDRILATLATSTD